MSTMAAADPLILVVEAHALVASALAVALRHAGFARVVSVDPSQLEANGDTVPAEATPGAIVLLGLLQGDGRTTLALIPPLVDRGCRVLVMASDQALPLAGECLYRGAEAVLDNAMSFARLVESLRRLAAGESAMTDDERTALLESVERYETAVLALHRPFKALTEREAEVFAALVSGIAPKQIAHRRGITVYTVRGHIQRVLSKLDVSNEREALAMARIAGWP